MQKRRIVLPDVEQFYAGSLHKDIPEYKPIRIAHAVVTNGGNTLRMDYSVPSRGNIYDRDGDVIAAQSDAHAFYVIPGNVTDESRDTLLSEVWRLCGISPEVLAEEMKVLRSQTSLRSYYPARRGCAWQNPPV